jgi:hypothetical protein
MHGRERHRPKATVNGSIPILGPRASHPSAIQSKQLNRPVDGNGNNKPAGLQTGARGECQ